MNYYIGIDLAWGEKNPSGFCVLQDDSKSLKILQLELLYSLEEILSAIEQYSSGTIAVGIDAPLIIPNESGNREIEKKFNTDFSKYKISMLPVNRKIMSKYSSDIRSEVLYEALVKCGFERRVDAEKSIFEVYPHATIAVCFNNYAILPYKRKKGRNTAFIKKQLEIYRNYIKKVVDDCTFFDEKIDSLRGKRVKDYEDKLDAITSAYTLYYINHNIYRSYDLEGVATFVTPL